MRLKYGDRRDATPNPFPECRCARLGEGDNNPAGRKVAHNSMVENAECAPSMREIPAVILAGGRSRRMGGGDKCLLALGGRPVLTHVIARIRPQVAALALNANGDPARFAAFDLAVLPDSVPDFAGPLAGVLAAFDWAVQVAPEAGHVLTVPADTPFLPRDLVARLAAAIDATHDTALAESGGRLHPVVGLWPLARRDALRLALEEGLRKVEDWTGRLAAARITFDAVPVDPFFNVNDPDDLAAATRLLARPD